MWSSLVWFCVWAAEVANSNFADPTTNHHVIIKSTHHIVAEQWRRVRVMTLIWSKLMALSSGMFLWIPKRVEFIEIWETWYYFDCGHIPCYPWNNSVHSFSLFCFNWNIGVFWNQNLCWKETTIYSERRMWRYLHGMWL